jgi:hypothetical protein
MAHSCIGLLSSLPKSPGGSQVATPRSPRMRALLSYLTVGAQRFCAREQSSSMFPVTIG